MANFRYNTLEFVNKILLALDFDAVTTLGETEESEQVLALVDRNYAELDLDINWFPRKTIVNLTTSTGSAFDLTTGNWFDSYPAVPWAMGVPEGIEAVYKVYYNEEELSYISPEDFMYRINQGMANKTDAAPKYWTTGLLDQNYIFFDSFDSDTESYLAASNSKAYVTKYPRTKISTDSQELELPEIYFNALLYACLEEGFGEIVKNIPMSDRYTVKFKDARAKLMQRQKLSRLKTYHPGEANFSRHRNKRNNRYIFPSEYTGSV